MDLQSKIRSISQKYGITEENEVGGIVSLFGEPSIQNVLEKTEYWRKIKIGIYLLATIPVVYYFLKEGAQGGFQVKTNGHSHPSTLFDGIWIAFTFFSFFSAMLFISFHGKAERTLKSVIIRRLLLLMNSSARFSLGSEYSFSIENLSKTGLLVDFHEVGPIEDSIEFTHEQNGKSIHIQGMEVITWNSSTDSHGKETRTTVNHCYMVRGEYEDTCFKIDKDVLIKTDTTTMPKLSLGMFFASLLFSGVVYTVAIVNTDSLFVSILLCIVAGFVLYYGARRLRARKQRIGLENIEFEKLFDVYCEDQVLARMILTPAIMDKFVHFSQKIKEKYEFLFHGKYVYVKKDLQNDYLEVSGWKNIKTNAEMFLKWYVELKELVSLISDTGVLVFAKTEVSISSPAPNSHTNISDTQMVPNT